MEKNKSNYSLYTLLATVVTAVVIFVMSLLLTSHYFTTKTKLITELQNKSNITTTRISNSIAPFIESYSMNDYEKLIMNEMKDKSIVAIIVDDYYAANILGKATFYNGKIRDENWNIETYETDNQLHKKRLNEIFLSSEDFTVSQSATIIGKVTVYYTDTFLRQDLDELIKYSVLIVIAVSFLLIVILFFLLNRVILQPIQKIVDTLLIQNKHGIPLNNIQGKGSKEFNLLSSVINNMLSTITTSQKELKALNERFELTLDAVNDGIWDWNIKTDEAYFSKKWKSMLGYDEDELENNGRAFFELLHDDYKAHLENVLMEHFQDPVKNKFNLQIQLKCKDGSYKWILTRGKVILNANNEPVRMVGYHTDITVEKQQEEYIKQKDQQIAEQSKLVSMGEMIGNIAHQWRQPLSIISTGSTGLIVQKEYGLLTTEMLNDTCNIINENAQYLSKTIDDFRDFIKDNRDKAQFNLSNSIQSFLTLTKGTAKNHEINVVSSLDDSITLFNYENQLIQCCINIFNNAKDALINEEKKYFFIKTFIKDDHAVIVCHDNAGGISKDILPRIFEPYFTTKHKSQGTGLGLHITHSLINVGMGGTVSAKNIKYNYDDKEFVGVEFTITLPMNVAMGKKEYVKKS